MFLASAKQANGLDINQDEESERISLRSVYGDTQEKWIG